MSIRVLNAISRKRKSVAFTIQNQNTSVNHAATLLRESFLRLVYLLKVEAFTPQMDVTFSCS